ncbi:hypothetical protein [Mucilaginibacter sp.]|uniref:hypothetical protein n=1 Tax=Mucilaginibacter sp. TaxID=1882438 RepID=UPI003D0B6562
MKNGKAYWVKDTFEYIASPEEKPLEHTTALVDIIVFSDDLIKMFVPKQKFLDRDYHIELKPDEIGLEFNGIDGDVTISCEVFSNLKKIMIYGNWKEREHRYTWWLIAEK